MSYGLSSSSRPEKVTRSAGDLRNIRIRSLSLVANNSLKRIGLAAWLNSDDWKLRQLVSGGQAESIGVVPDPGRPKPGFKLVLGAQQLVQGLSRRGVAQAACRRAKLSTHC